MLSSEGDRLLRVVVCSPETEYFQVGNLKEHNITQISNPEKAKRQHNSLKSRLRHSGARVINIPELPGHPNSVFTRDTAVCTSNGYIKLRMGLSARRGEEDWMSGLLDSLGELQAGNIKEPATVEGGDVILAGSVAFLGHSRRTNKEGIAQISLLLKEMDYEIRTIPVPPPYLHLGGAMSIIGPECVMCIQGFFPDDFFFGFDKIEISSRTFISGNVISLGNNEVIADVSNVDAIKELKKMRIKVHPIDLSEFIKGYGGPGCLIMPVERRK
ncbi:amidinotransferase [candidate division WOR-3 bacterium]|nr:amidinotransferase [candidate division WOR-3 bacterium]